MVEKIEKRVIQDSVELFRNEDGEYRWRIICHAFDDPKEAIKKVEIADNLLKKTFVSTKVFEEENA